MQTMGGFLPLELPEGTEYYQGDGVIPLNAGRYAAVTALELAKVHKVWLPYYSCRSLVFPIRKAGFEIGYYRLDDEFLPADLEPSDHEAVLWVNHWGVLPADTLHKVRRRYPNLVVDHTQAFFADPLPGVYSLYSCRKFFGVSDGAYLIRPGLPAISFPPETNGWSRAVYLLKSIELGTEAAYADAQRAEESLAAAGRHGMSNFTRRILQSIDYQSAQKLRLRNYQILHERLSGENIHPFPIPEKAPMVYPFFSENLKLRQFLIKNKIFIPTYWRHLFNENRAPEAQRIARQLFPLPIDPHCSEKQIEQMADLILSL